MWLLFFNFLSSFLKYFAAPLWGAYMVMWLWVEVLLALNLFVHLEIIFIISYNFVSLQSMKSDTCTAIADFLRAILLAKLTSSNPWIWICVFSLFKCFSYRQKIVRFNFTIHPTTLLHLICVFIPWTLSENIAWSFVPSFLELWCAVGDGSDLKKPL